MSAVGDRDVAIIGFHDGAAGQVSAWFERVTGLRVVCYVHEGGGRSTADAALENTRRVSQRTEYPRAGTFRGKALIESADWVGELSRMGVGRVLPLTGDNRVRASQIEACHRAGITLVSAIHPTATVLDEALIAPGVWINAGAVIGFKAEIAEGAIVNTRASLDHHNIVEACAQVDPGVITAGFVTLRARAHVHTAAAIVNRVTIGEDAVVGAGAVVLRDVPPRVTVVGVPAEPIGGLRS